MTRVFIADGKPEERSALRLLLQDLKMEVVGEAADWTTTLANAPTTPLNMLLVDWDLLPVRLVRRLARSAKPARLRWSSSSSVIWTPVSKQLSPPAPMHLSVRVKCPSAWPTAYVRWRRAFPLEDANWLNEGFEIRRAKAVPSAGDMGQLFQRVWRNNPMN